MEVTLTPEQQAFVQQGISTGRLAGEQDAIQEALALWEERERRRLDLMRAIENSDEDMRSGNYTTYTDETLPQLAAELKREARVQRDRREKA